MQKLIFILLIIPSLVLAETAPNDITEVVDPVLDSGEEETILDAAVAGDLDAINAINAALADEVEDISPPKGLEEVVSEIDAKDIEEAAIKQSDDTDPDAILEALSCQDDFTEIPPFYVSSTTNRSDSWKIGTNQGDPKLNAIENFRNEKGEATKRIARGSVVTIRGKNRIDLAKKLKAGGDGWRVPVKVKSANDTYTQFHKDKNKFVAKDDEGYIWSKSLGKPKDDQTFVVMEDSYLTPDVEDTNLKGKGLKPVTDKDGKYKVKQCCREEMPEPRYAKNSDGSPVRDGNGKPIRVVQTDEQGNEIPPEPILKCDESYFYTIVGGKGDSELNGKEITINHECFDKAIRPLVKKEKDQFEDMMAFMNENYGTQMSLDQMMFNDFGAAALPLKNMRDTTATVAGEGMNDKFIYYKNGDPYQSDLWGKPTTICSLYNLTDKFYDACIKKEGRTPTNCKARVGDLSFVTPGEKSNGKDVLGHASHSSGNCIDLRPFRKDESFGRTTVSTKSTYSRELNEEFIDMAKELGASPIYLNDSNIKNSSHMGGHADHIHICFPPTNTTVSKSCSQRKKPAAAPAVAVDANADINSEK